MKKEKLLLAAFVWIFCTANLSAYASGILRTRVPDKPGAAIIEPKLEAVSINVEIFDQLAMVTLDETYAVIPDTSQDSVFTFLGAYTLTLPQGAEISELALSLYDSLQPQPIVRFQDAQRFHEGVSIGSEDPLFPENDQENIFRIGLYPVTESVNNRVVVKYFLTLPKVGDVVEFRLPISRRIADTKFKLSLKSQTPIDSVWTPNNLPITCPSEMECSIDYFTPDSLSDFLLYYAFAEERLYTALSYEDPNPLQDGYFILWTTPPDDFFDVDVEIRDRHIVFCLDVSTAMGEELAPVRNSLETIINQLRSTDRFNILAYDGSLDLLNGNNLLSVDSSSIADATAFLRDLEPIESNSDLHSTLDEALSLLKNSVSSDSTIYQIIVASRAMPNQGVTNGEAIRQLLRTANQDDVQIYPIRINTSAGEDFFREMAKENFGESFNISAVDNLQQRVIEIIEGITLPTLTEVEFIDESPLPNIRQFYPELTPDLSKAMQFIKTGRYGPEQSATLKLQADNGQASLDTSVVIDFSAVSQTEAVRRFWAVSKIASLDPGDVGAMVEMSQQFQVLSDYTAFPFVGLMERPNGVTASRNKREETSVIEGFSLYQNYPNPFNPETTIAFRLTTNNTVILRVYNMLGQLVRILVNERKQPGEYAILWDGRNDNGALMPTGLYIYSLQVGNFQTSRKMLMVK